MARVFLGVGANLNPEQNIVNGIRRLADDVAIASISPAYLSPAVGFDGPDFINLVVQITTDASVAELNQLLKLIETEFGRTPDAVKYSSRALDIDILLYDDLSGDIDGIQLPRTDVQRFAFVLRPLLDLWPDAECPATGQTLREFWPAVADQPLKETEISALEALKPVLLSSTVAGVQRV